MAMTFLSLASWSLTGDFLEGIVGTTVEGFGEQAIVTGAHAVVGGAFSVALGGSFLEAFAAGGIGDIESFAGFGFFGKSPDGLFARTALAAGAGGTRFGDYWRQVC